MNKVEYFKSFDLNEELQLAADFLSSGLDKLYKLTSCDIKHEIDYIFYNLSVGIERIQKVLIYLDSVNDEESYNKTIKDSKKHNLIQLHNFICDKFKPILSIEEATLLNVLSIFYKDYRYDNFTFNKTTNSVKLFNKFLFETQQNSFNYNDLISKKKTYFKNVGTIIKTYYNIINQISFELNIYTTEFCSSSNAFNIYYSTDLFLKYEMLNNSILEFLISLLNSEDTDIYKRIKEIEPLSYIKEDFAICLKEILENKPDLLIGFIQSNFDSEFTTKERKLILSTLKNDMY